MMRAVTCLSCAALLSGPALSQPAEPAPTFEAADVHESHTSSPFPYIKGPSFRGGMYQVRTATMVDLIAAAYSISAEKVLGGPSWLEMDRFDALAKVPAKSTPETRKAMLQALLADRFKLVVHNDTKSMPAYALTVGKRPTLKKADGSGEPGCKFVPPAGAQGGGAGGPGGPPPTISFSCHSVTMAKFADELRSFVGGPQFFASNQVPVVDQTKLEGSFDFDYRFSLPGMMRAASAGETITIFDAVDKQLGLKLESTQIPMPVLVVDSLNRKPTGNLPGIQETLHSVPVPTEFEVAEVKPSDPDFKGMRFQIQPGGRVNLQGVTLKFLFQQAWDISEDMLAGAPKWMDTDRFDIIAKASTEVVPAAQSPGQQPDIDFDAVLAMVRTLVTERFKLATHTEERPVSAYTLVAVKPKMKKADPTSRTLFKEGPATLGAKDPRNTNPALARLVTVQNMTMAQFADKLRSIAPGYIHSPVLDATGLDGSWDFTLSFSPAGMAGGGGRGGEGGRGGGGEGGRGPEGGQPAGVVPEASDPGTGLTLLEAIEKEIGLKLVMQKRPLPVLVIDHIEQKPDN
jgi:uncharacterized protein (TIGR03435 family)